MKHQKQPNLKRSEMYKLKSKKGEVTTIRMNGFQYSIVGGAQYDQTFLEKLYRSGHKKLVSKSKVKIDEK